MESLLGSASNQCVVNELHAGHVFLYNPQGLSQARAEPPPGSLQLRVLSLFMPVYHEKIWDTLCFIILEIIASIARFDWIF